MNMIAKLTRPQLQALAYVGFLALLSAISSLSNGAAGLDRDLSAARACNEVTTSAAEARHASVNW
jgi:hypothetical protein